jgi:hypothetical protein
MKLHGRRPLVWLVIVSFLISTICSCAGVQAPKPKVLMPAASYPNSITVSGVSIAAVIFDPNRDIYASPNEVRPRKPDFNWFKAGVCPTRFIIENHSNQSIQVDPTQITCTDMAGVTYKPYDAREAGDAVVASEAFNSYVRGAIAGAIIGAAIGAGLGAALGGIVGGRGWAGGGAALGAVAGGGEGLVLGSVANRQAMENRARILLISNQLQAKALGQEMTDDGLIYFPAVNIKSIKLLIAVWGGQQVIRVDLPVTMPVQEKPSTPATGEESQPTMPAQ